MEKSPAFTLEFCLALRNYIKETYEHWALWKWNPSLANEAFFQIMMLV